MTVDTAQTRTEVGNYFVSNYPPFSQWKPEFVPAALDVLNQPARVADPLGLYIHIPFCRKRCLFCYFKVYTDKILAANGRAHLSPEIYRAYHWARQVDFPQINIELIAGMMGETEEKWRETVQRTVELEPDSVTIYQMELPYNTVISQDMLKKGIESPIADWPSKRRWLDYAFEQFLKHDYEIAGSE